MTDEFDENYLISLSIL